MSISISEISNQKQQYLSSISIHDAPNLIKFKFNTRLKHVLHQFLDLQPYIKSQSSLSSSLFSSRFQIGQIITEKSPVISIPPLTVFFYFFPISPSDFYIITSDRILMTCHFSFLARYLDEAVQYINLGYGVQTQKIVIL